MYVKEKKVKIVCKLSEIKMSQSENTNNSMDNQMQKNENSANDSNNTVNERKKIRRAFSMPRSIPLSFRLSVSRRKKNNKDSSAINETNTQINVNTDPTVSIPSDNNNCSAEPTKTKNFRRSWKKFLSRVAQQMTSINIGVSGFFSIVSGKRSTHKISKD